ncbi:MAG: DUF502 domain-containing protein, partial [Candidatus Hydrothermia bacterium]|nr:DUF502 domain-containing protein [Candidatus Hydrothermia bacterium]
MKSPISFRKLKGSFKKETVREDFITGLLVLGPLLVTIYLVVFLVSVIGNFFARIVAPVPFVGSVPPFLKTIFGLVIGILLIYIAGLLVRLVFGLELESFVNRTVNRIPVVKTIYSAVREFLKYITNPRSIKISSGRVVLFTISDGGPFLMGFLTRDEPLEVEGKRFYMVFMPTTPNPTTGFYFVVEESRLSFVDMSFEEGTKIAMTAGISMNTQGGEIIQNGIAEVLKRSEEHTSE